MCEYIANRLKNNIRQLEGAVKKLRAFHLLENKPINIATAQAAISDIINNNQPAPVTVDKIIEEVARTFSGNVPGGITPEDIRSKKRNANISMARQVSIYIAREITNMSMVEIGQTFGGRDHSTVVYAIRQAEQNIIDIRIGPPHQGSGRRTSSKISGTGKGPKIPHSTPHSTNRLPRLVQNFFSFPPVCTACPPSPGKTFPSLFQGTWEAPGFFHKSTAPITTAKSKRIY